MALAPKTAGSKAGLPHENPGSPQQSSTNDKHLLSLIKDLGAGGIVRLQSSLSATPPLPPRGEGQIYLSDDGVGGPVQLIVTYTLADGTSVSGVVALA